MLLILKYDPGRSRDSPVSFFPLCSCFRFCCICSHFLEFCPPHCVFFWSRHWESGLTELCLLSCFQMDKRKDPSSVDIKKVLLEMRKFRMGLIQTADQLRFSYLAVIEGAKFIMGDSSVQVSIAFALIQVCGFSVFDWRWGPSVVEVQTLSRIRTNSCPSCFKSRKVVGMFTSFQFLLPSKCSHREH